MTAANTFRSAKIHSKMAVYTEVTDEELTAFLDQYDLGQVTAFKGIAEVARIWQVPTRAALETLDDLHCWTPAHLDMRFGYKPDNPLYLVAVRCSRLKDAKTISHHAAYTGCKSWFDLRPDDQIDEASGMEPVIDDPTFATLLERIDTAMA